MLNRLKPKSEFSRNVLTLMTGTTIAQAIPIAISPILTRLYTPEDFGVFALYISISSIISVLATGNYEHAIMLPKEDKDAINIVALSIIISFFVSFVIFLLILLFNSQITILLGNPEISPWLYFIPLTVLLTGLYQSFNYWANRKKEYKILAKSKIIQNGTSAIFNICMGFVRFGKIGLIMGTIIGQFASVFILGKNIRKDKNNIESIKKKKIIFFAKKYINFLKFSTFSSLLNALSFNLLSILLSKVFSAKVLGFYSLVFRVLSFPGMLIGSSISQVYFQEATKQKNLYGNNKEIFILTLKKLFIIASLVYLPMYFYITDLMTFVFGEQWKIAGEIAKILIPLMFIRFISSTLSSTLTTYEKQKAGLFINFLLLLNMISIFFYSYTNNLNYIEFFRVYTVSSSILYFIFVFYYYKLSKGGK